MYIWKNTRFFKIFKFLWIFTFRIFPNNKPVVMQEYPFVCPLCTYSRYTDRSVSVTFGMQEYISSEINQVALK